MRIRRGASNVRALYVLGAVFIAGGAAGIAVDRFTLLRNSVIVARGEGWHEPTPNAEARRAMATGIPTHMLRLDLTPEQQAKLTSIARRRRPQAESVLKTLQPLARNMETQMMQEMLCALTPAQQAHWLAFMDTAKFDTSVVAERYRPVRTNTCAEVMQR
jgi:hypothetical protein